MGQNIIQIEEEGERAGGRAGLGGGGGWGAEAGLVTKLLPGPMLVGGDERIIGG